MIARLFVGIGIGAIVPIIPTIQMEVSTQKLRGITNVLSGGFFYIGGTFAILLLILITPDLRPEN